MFILTEDETLAKGVHALGGNVPRRKHRLNDFKSTFILSLTLIPSVLLTFYSPLADISIRSEGTETYGQLGIAFMVIFGFVVLCSFANSKNKPQIEQQYIAEGLCQKWETEMLIPYLERKHGVKFYNKELRKHGYNSVTKDFRTFEVSISGLSVRRDYNYGEHGHCVWKYEILDSEGPWLEEVIRPKQISYQTMPTVA